MTSPKDFKEIIAIDRLSNCCGAKVDYDSDICQDCGEHCAVTCPECYGDGVVDVLEDYQGDAITPRIKTITCPECHGEGVIE